MYWLIGAVLLFVAEMFLGTFYLLVISASLVSAGLADWLLDTPTPVNVSIASLFSIIGMVLVRRWQKKHRRPPAADDDLDIGQTVVLEQQLPDGLWLVRYRGSQWQAQPDGAGHCGQQARITGKHGNILLLTLSDQRPAAD